MQSFLPVAGIGMSRPFPKRKIPQDPRRRCYQIAAAGAGFAEAASACVM